MNREFKALRTIGTIYKTLGILAGIITIFITVGLCATSVLGGAAMDKLGQDLGGSGGAGGIFSGILGGFVLSAISIIYGGGISLTLYAAGEGVYLLLALEENTRATAVLLKENSNR